MENALIRLLAAVEDAPASLSGIFADWEQLDDDMRDQYTSDTEWMLTALHRQLLERPLAEVCALVERTESALLGIASLSDAIYAHMGFRTEDVLSPGSAARMVAVRSSANVDAKGNQRPANINVQANTRVVSIAGVTERYSGSTSFGVAEVKATPRASAGAEGEEERPSTTSTGTPA